MIVVFQRYKQQFFEQRKVILVGQIALPVVHCDSGPGFVVVEVDQSGSRFLPDFAVLHRGLLDDVFKLLDTHIKFFDAQGEPSKTALPIKRQM